MVQQLAHSSATRKIINTHHARGIIDAGHLNFGNIANIWRVFRVIGATLDFQTVNAIFIRRLYN